MGSSNSTPTAITCIGENCPAVVEAVYDTDVLQKTAEDMADHVELWFWNKKTKEEKAQDELVKIDDSLVAFGKVTNLQKSTNPSVEDDGCCGKANPIVPADVAPVILVFDILCPGLGTMIAAYYDPNGCNCATITCAIFQMMLGVVLVGWIWSIIQGVQIYNKSNAYWEAQATTTAVTRKSQ